MRTAAVSSVLWLTELAVQVRAVRPQQLLHLRAVQPLCRQCAAGPPRVPSLHHERHSGTTCWLMVNTC